jgi:hypothetical protein
MTAVSEPMPGWIDNWGGATERVAQTALGVIRQMEAIPDHAGDVVPVDMVNIKVL